MHYSAFRSQLSVCVRSLAYLQNFYKPELLASIHEGKFSPKRKKQSKKDATKQTAIYFEYLENESTDKRSCGINFLSFKTSEFPTPI